jgi:cyclopropane-fatty-acyl-phospholipid synthase
MVYSCAYFSSPEEDLPVAQERKLEYICRKLRLQAGDRFLDIGCGWGGLILYAASKYGVEAHGITLSERQADLATSRIREAGLSDRCRVEIRDYREVEAPGRYDKISSVGMFEHVGAARLREYFERAHRLLRPGGVLFNQGLSHPTLAAPQRSPSFTDRYSYPDYELVPVHETVRIAEEAGLEVRDVECLREHEALTMRRACRRLEAQHEAAVAATDEPTYRVWRLFLAGLAYECEKGYVSLYQTLFAKPDRGDASWPLTRADWYR